MSTASGPWRAIAEQALLATGTFALAATGAFALVVAAPGDPVDLMGVDEAVRPVLEARWGLDRSVPERLASWLSDAARGELGHSLSVRPGAPVGELLVPALSRSAPRLALATLFGALAASLLAVLPRRGVAALIPLLSAPPAFLAIHALVYGLNEAAFAGLQGGWWGRPSWFALPDQASWLREALAIAVLATASGTLAAWREELAQGVARWRVSPQALARLGRGESLGPMVARHLLPATAVATAAQLPALVGGLVVVEKLLLLPGAGGLLWDAALLRDHELVLSLATASALVVVAGGFALRAAAIALDPRRWVQR